MNARAALVLVALLVIPTVLVAAPVTSAAARPLRIAVVDTGIAADHPEFAPGQVVAWKDFTAEASPTPKDGFGHGTATASLVAGLNVGGCGDNANAPKLSFAPGAQLIIARVGDDAGNIVNLDAGIDWAVAQGVDVLSLSIGSTVPEPGLTTSAALHRARLAGVLPIVSAGNGLGNFGTAPTPAWMNGFGGMQEVVSVGALTRTGGNSLIGNSDPDVASWGSSVCVAKNTGGYVRESGTSFAAPLVAGMAGRALDEARANGAPSSADAIERVLLLCATNSIALPYHREGMGFLLDGQFPRVLANARAGTSCDYDAQGAYALADRQYHDVVLEQLRFVL